MNIVFDFGGVVFHWKPAELLQRVLPERAHDAASTRHWVAEFFQSYGGDWGEFDRGMLKPAALVQHIAQRTGLTPHEVQRVVDAVPAELQPEAAVVQLMHRLIERGHTLHYLSNMPAPFALHLETTHAFMQWFQSGLFSSRVHVIKPERAIFELAAQRFGQQPANLLFIDDSLPNVVAARELGWQSLLFDSAAQLEAEMGDWLG